MESKMLRIKDVANKLVEVPGLAAVILYGSYARGDFDEGSDVDLFILFDTKQSMRRGYDSVIKILSRSNLFIQGNIRSLKELKNSDPHFLQKVFSEGKILHWKPELHIDLIELLKLKPMVLIEYSLKNLAPARKCKLAFTLLGRRMRKYRYKGLVEKLGGWRIGKSSFIIPFNVLSTVEKVLESNEISYTMRIIWTTIS